MHESSLYEFNNNINFQLNLESFRVHFNRNTGHGGSATTATAVVVLGWFPFGKRPVLWQKLATQVAYSGMLTVVGVTRASIVVVVKHVQLETRRPFAWLVSQQGKIIGGHIFRVTTTILPWWMIVDGACFVVQLQCCEQSFHAVGSPLSSW